jgi:hypothetical protein
MIGRTRPRRGGTVEGPVRRKGAGDEGMRGSRDKEDRNTHKSMQQVITRRIIVITTRIIREVITQRRPGQLLSKEINLVQEEDLDNREVG